jgi:hypothetical protein
MPLAISLGELALYFSFALLFLSIMFALSLLKGV